MQKLITCNEIGSAHMQLYAWYSMYKATFILAIAVSWLVADGDDCDQNCFFLLSYTVYIEVIDKEWH